MATAHSSTIASERYRLLAIALRVFAVFAVASGAYDIVTGTAFLTGMGAELGAGADDAVLNSQLRFLSAVWLGFGAIVWWVSNDLARRGTALTILSATVFVGGLSRLAAAPVYGTGGLLFVAFMVIEIVGPIIVLLVYRRLRGLGPAAP